MSQDCKVPEEIGRLIPESALQEIREMRPLSWVYLIYYLYDALYTKLGPSEAEAALRKAIKWVQIRVGKG